MAAMQPFASEVPLAPHTTMAVGGKARYWQNVATVAELRAVLQQAHHQSLPITILGGGSNVIIADSGIDGLVLRFVGQQVHANPVTHGVELWVQAGCPLDDLVALAVKRNWAGITCLAGIPGWCGACPMQNVGAYGCEIGQVLLGVEALDQKTLQLSYLPKAQLQLAYRNSIFKHQWRQRYVLTALHLRLADSGQETIAYQELQRVLSSKQAPLAIIRQAVLALRASKGMLVEPTSRWLPSCGSFFTNPIVPTSQRQQLQQNSPSHVPHWPYDASCDKLSAAWLVEQAGFPKGWRAPNQTVGISSQHALCLVNLGQATSEAIVQTAEHIRQQVWQRFAVALQPEPEHLGFSKPPYHALPMPEPLGTSGQT